MNNLHPTHLRVAAVLIACVIIAGFLVSAVRMRDARSPKPAEEAATTTVPSVALRDSFKKGVHTITGMIEVPDACTTPSVDVTLAGDASSTESILVSISLPEDAGVCLEIATQARFSATLAAPAGLPISVTVNGAGATVTPL